MMEEIEFTSRGITCRAWLCTPESDELTGGNGSPALVMAHGTSGVREQLKHYVPRFAEAGMYVLLFDYRHFGTSDGEPRQLLSIRRQLQDYAAALEYIRNVPGVDPDRVGVWGSSLSGGHAVDVAVRDGRVAAVVAQAAAMDNLKTVLRVAEYAGVGQLVKLTGLGMVDVARSAFGMSPKLVPAGGEPGELAMMTTPDTMPGLAGIAAEGWRNELCGRLSLTLALHRPGRKTHRLPCPAFFAICDKDSLVVPAATVKAAERAGDLATVKHYAMGHFDIYLGDWFEQTVNDQITFLKDCFVTKQ